jgi:lysozyme family protein
VARARKRGVAGITGRTTQAPDPLDEILTRVIAVETGPRGDGFVNRVADRGGATMRGVTLPACNEFLGRTVSADDMREMFRCRNGKVDCRACDGCALLRRFYRRQYVERFRFDRILEPALQALLVDWAVTSYGVTPTKALQRALGLTGADVDGKLGPATERLLRTADPREVYLKVLRARSEFYIDIALNDPKVKTFMRDNPDVQLHNLRGWNRERVLAFLS